MTVIAKEFSSKVVAAFNPQNIIEEGVFDTLLFSDRYRRGVFFFGGDRNGLVSETAELIKKLGVMATYYYTDSGYTAKDGVNRDVMDRVLRHIKDIDWRAKSLGAEKIILPFGGRGNIFASALKNALKDHKFETAVELRGREYRLDLSNLGPVQKDKHTILDEGIRGVCHYKQDLRYKWDREVA